MNIVILSNTLGGIYSFRKELISELLKTNTVSVYASTNRNVKEMKSIGAIVNDIAIDTRGVNIINDIKYFVNVLRVLLRERPNLVITYTIKPNIYGGLACRLLKIPYAVNITGLGTAFQQKGLLKTMVTILYRIALKKAKIVYFENVENQSYFLEEKIIREDQAHLLNGAGVNLEKYQVKPYPSGDLTNFIFVGRVMKEKGMDELLDAMKMLINDGVECSLSVVGGLGDNYEDTISKYENEDWFFYYGFQQDVIPFFEKSHCFVLPSWHEGMANTNLEAAAMARPVITSNIHGCLEAVEEGVSGFLVEPHNSQSLYMKMKEFSALSYDERKSMGLAGRSKMERQFDKRKVVEETIRQLF